MISRTVYAHIQLSLRSSQVERERFIAALRQPYHTFKGRHVTQVNLGGGELAHVATQDKLAAAGHT